MQAVKSSPAALTGALTNRIPANPRAIDEATHRRRTEIDMTLTSAPAHSNDPLHPSQEDALHAIQTAASSVHRECAIRLYGRACGRPEGHAMVGLLWNRAVRRSMSASCSVSAPATTP